MNFTDYNEKIYTDIQNDEELNSFFKGLTQRADKILQIDKENEYKINNVNKPSFDELANVISILAKEGIVTAREDCSIEECTDETLYGRNLPYFVTFYTLKFYGISFNYPDIEHLQNYDGTQTYIENLEEEYKKWVSGNKNIYKKLEQEKRKHEKLKNKGKEDINQLSLISNLQYRIASGEELKQKIEFFKERNLEKIVNILKVHDMIKKLSEDYDEYLSNKKTADKEVEKMSKDIYYRAFEELTKNSMTEIDTTGIERKLFKLLIFNKLEKSPFVFRNSDFEGSNSETVSFDTASVDWFIRTKKAKFQELFDYVFDNFETSMEGIKEKVLKK